MKIVQQKSIVPKIGKRVIPVINIVAGLVAAFLALLLVRATHPIVSAVLGLWTSTTIMSVVANLIMWIMYFFVLYFLVYIKFFSPPQQDQNEVSA